MVVDDNADILNIIQTALRKWNLFSDGFTNPVTALEQFRLNSGLYGLVISDLKMPEMSGFDLIERIARIKPEVKVMVITAFFQDMVDIPDVLSGILKIDSVLEKPFGIKKICEKVKAQLNQT